MFGAGVAPLFKGMYLCLGGESTYYLNIDLLENITARPVHKNYHLQALKNKKSDDFFISAARG